MGYNNNFDNKILNKYEKILKIKKPNEYVLLLID
jgi:hypothetical protein